MNIKYFFLIFAFPLSSYTMDEAEAEIIQLHGQLNGIRKSTEEMNRENNQFKIALNDCEKQILNQQEQIKQIRQNLADELTELSNDQLLKLINELIKKNNNQNP